MTSVENTNSQTTSSVAGEPSNLPATPVPFLADKGVAQVVYCFPEYAGGEVKVRLFPDRRSATDAVVTSVRTLYGKATAKVADGADLVWWSLERGNATSDVAPSGAPLIRLDRIQPKDLEVARAWVDLCLNPAAGGPLTLTIPVRPESALRRLLDSFRRRRVMTGTSRLPVTEPD